MEMEMKIEINENLENYINRIGKVVTRLQSLKNKVSQSITK